MRLFLLALALLFAGPALATPLTPHIAVQDLLAADRAFSESAAARDPVEGIVAMFAEDVTMPTPHGFVNGRYAAAAAMRANPAFAAAPGVQAHARWRPIRAGLSADTLHGFTWGYLDLDGTADRARSARRYLAYWVRGSDGWRVAVYRQIARHPGEADLPEQPPSLPGRIAMPTPAATARHQASVSAAESAFSARAARVGLRTAFAEYGRPDSMNMGAPNGFVIGADTISTTLFDAATTTDLSWAADRSIAASSGDLAVTIGTIRLGTRGSVPFFTIWRRDGPNAPWRYIAE